MAKHKMGKRVTPDEEAWVARLLEAKKSVVTIVRKTGISRSRIYELRNNPPPPKRLPTTPLQHEAYDRCQFRSEEYPQGDHTWMSPGIEAQRYEDQAFCKEVFYEDADPESMPTVRHILTCYFCRYREEWSTEGVPIVERAFGEQLSLVTKKTPYKEETPG